MCDKKSLKKLTKKELLSMIAKMKKDELINIIHKNSFKLKQRGGTEGGEIIKETKNAVRKSIVFNQSKLYELNNNNIIPMNNNGIYNNV